MADFVWFGRKSSPTHRFEKLYKRDSIEPSEGLFIFGKNETYTQFKQGEDFITILGYACFPGESIQDTAEKILEDFMESKISTLKKQLVGQYLILIKKNHSIYIFSDFFQTRNIFYSKDLDVICSSFSVTEDLLDTKAKDFNFEKVVEYIATKYITYPCWLGNKTTHININRLRPFEYVVLDRASLSSRIGSLTFDINNIKEYTLQNISSQLIDNLKDIIENPNFVDEKIGVTLTGGYDTRIIAAIASNYYKNISFRLAISKKILGSLTDLKIAKKIAKAVGLSLDVFSDTHENSIDDFYFITEGLAPSQNSIILPIIQRTNSYNLGLGGCFGTELFYPMDYAQIGDYIDESIVKAKKYITANEKIWTQFRQSLLEEFVNIEKHYILSDPNPNDSVRLFYLLNTGFFSSPMLSPYNIKGLQLEPFGHFSILETALKIPKESMGNNNLFQRNLIQKMTLSKLNPSIAKIQTTHYQPMMPFKARSFPYYMLGLFRLILNEKIFKSKTKHIQNKRNRINGISHLSDGWDMLFLRRIKEIYNVDVEILETH